MICLGIESTAHTFGIGIVEDDKVIANVRDAYKPKTGGIVPHEARAHHEEVKEKLVKTALEQSKLDIKDIDIFAISSGPGLPPCLLVGFKEAKKLSQENNKPLIGVNHCIAHIEIGKLATGFKDPLVVYASGGNTQVIGLNDRIYRVFGETLDIGLGNAIDKFARAMDLEMPGGPKVDELAAKGKKLIELPYTVKGMDLVYTGLVTNVSEKIGKFEKEDLCYSFCETAYAMLCEISERALAHTEKKELILTGGVAASKRLQQMFETMCLERDVKFGVPVRELCGDNGAMIAYTGLIMHKSKNSGNNKDIRPDWRTDECEVTWY